MTIEQVMALIKTQADGHSSDEKHGIALAQVLVEPQKISLIVRTVRDGRISDKEESVWLVGQEPGPDGYSIVMQAEGKRFGVASSGFSTDSYLVLVGWYGDLVSTFLNM